MPIRPDLHTHSTASDGALSPEALVARAAAAGVDLLALTDHDTTSGLASAARAARAAGIRFVPGVEVSVTWERCTLHIVGLGVDPSAPALRAGLERLRGARESRAEEIGRRLRQVGIDAACEGARALSAGRLIGRVHFARFLVARGYAADVRQVFKRYLVKGKPGYVAGQWASLAEALSWIRHAGGQAVIAHPARYGFTRAKTLRMIAEFQECGGQGIEVVCASHSRDDASAYARHAREHGLLASIGSDYHGPNEAYLEVGRLPSLPDGCTPIWVDWDAGQLAEAICP
jgi:predicted metal-dependent phosphoesterase TrpH